MNLDSTFTDLAATGAWAIDPDPEDAASHLNRRHRKKRTGDQAGALADANPAPALDVNDNFTHFHFGEIIMKRATPPKAATLPVRE